MNLAYNNVVGPKRTRLGHQKANESTQIYFNARAQKKMKRAKTSLEQFAEWSASDSD